ncbi:2-succinyl-5-enolpyruvyl-6-hydroxy-3-cyclohexene-1-carboxylate synthase [Conexibacter arvalis]|uniref:2-succinyl-5-enolpyruvyl-6-hydroxy-3-cyclohexene-1-carboxylate synthase n=1 Tax=Conexibacter arvalis TaxID=912552 RepID=A0A840IHA3_9ACTN|nr:thiamine pyrophosphate-binding protein [Conexibacter arvalis]MBB4663705.1 2-succinyl-5-enolpyruvyl-6-hydroxy-3-cyclohexene-1-carboxylate synthase [Conexibacter arvalis]
MTATDTYLLLRAFCDELARCGMTDACTSPGSRSTPLVLSLAREPGLRSWSHVDERVAGFFALGLAKRTGRAVAVAVTSGTAAAELAPAVIEAAEARLPLIVLTADRPPELRDVGAGQTIDQLKLYGGAAKRFVEVGVVGEATPERLRWIRTLACRAVWTAQEGRAGVVHLNFPLREPLVLDGPMPPDPLPGRPDGRPWVARTAWEPEPDAASAPGTTRDGGGTVGGGVAAAGRIAAGGRGDAGGRGNAGGRGAAAGRGLAAATASGDVWATGRAVVIAGRVERGRALGARIAAFARDTGSVLLADPLSGARRGPAAIARYDALLRDPGFLAGPAARPDVVLRIGDVPTSKPLRAWLAGLDPAVPQIALDPERTWHDPDAVVGERVELPLEEALSRLEASRGAGDPAWPAAWRDADAATARAIAATIGTGDDEPLNEPRIAAEVAAALPADAALLVAASMPIRDVETFAAARDDGPLVLANRGANGIDGTVATALGLAAAERGPTALLVGDVTLAYDLSALLSAMRLGLDLAIVLVDNGGGGIFDFLPVATQTDHFEQHVATPHGLDFALAARLYGARHVPVATAAELRAALAEATRPGAGVTIVAAATDRAENVALHRRVWAAVAAELAR